MHIVKELIDNISSTSLNRFLTEQKIANEQRLSFSDHRVLLEQLCQSGLISVEDLNDFFFQELLYNYKNNGFNNWLAYSDHEDILNKYAPGWEYIE